MNASLEMIPSGWQSNLFSTVSSRRTNRALNFTVRALISASTATTVSTVQPITELYSVPAILFNRGRPLRLGQRALSCFKYALQTRLVDPYQLTVTVCHYPSGASKWNPIDHRLFSEISKNWAGHPLRCYRTILNHIRTTDTGLCVTVQLVDQEYPNGVKISDVQFASIALEPHQIQPLRNYTIRPRS